MSALRGFGLTVLLASLLVACGGQSNGPAASASATASSSATATPSANSAVVLAQPVGSEGTILVAGSNSHTLYTFDRDTPGVSNCKGGCITTWPALTVPSGTTPTAGAGVTGTLATITRDDGSVQVTYKGLPLYFFHNDSKAGDTKGNYTGWSLVKP
jgi:predicted lipoprotein with Yx(FWY)xxD motif